ncbi:Anaphase-promoting complex subunit 13 [Apodemus speciosus]|uniref:Anaphase-promoting complex subunit 13 n=1 Tax=Apodemus speciosus TaxID=105296 RepID=A0ABQ0F654_APOSI
MDSEVQRDGRILDLIDDAWREDKLPYEDVAIPLAGSLAGAECCGRVTHLSELPEPEQDNGGTTESVKEQEMKWADLALQGLHENVPPAGN